MNNILSLSSINNKHLIMILTRFNDNFRYKDNEKKTTNKMYDIDKIEDVYTKVCKYTQDKINEKTHLVIRFTIKNEEGIICLSILLDNYNDLIQ
jgi:hypothetical protein